MRIEHIQCAILSPEPFPLFLKSIDIVGFKSFAAPVRLELPPGITALVGPNGSGKSNVVDALRWAIGEQNIRDLRGARAEDVIHAGPRRSLGAAEVTLTLDAGGRSDVPAEIAVTRRLYRSGESEYLVQGKKGRLRDLQDILRGLGIPGADTVVVNQGMADALLVATPQERRMILEQAAGLAGYRARREEARTKVQATAQNVQTLEVILAELEPRLRVLRRQARAVRERDEARERLATALERWYAARWEAACADHARLAEESAHEDAARVRLNLELQALEESSERALAAERDWRRRLDTAQTAVHATQRELDAARFRLQASEKQCTALQTSCAGAESRLRELDATLAIAQTRRDEAAATATVLGHERATLAAELAERQRAERGEDERMTVLAATVAAAEAECASAERELAAVKAARAELQVETSRRRERLKTLATRKVETEQEHSRRVLEREACVRALHDAGAAAEVARNREAVERTARDAARAQVERAERVLRRLQARQTDIVRRRVGAERTVAASSADMTDSLLSELRVPIGWEAAAAVAAGSWPRGSAALPERARDLAGFLSWREKLTPLLEDACWADVVMAQDIRTVSPLHTAILVENLDLARKLWLQLAGEQAYLIGSPSVRVVTREGDVISSAGEAIAGERLESARYLRARREAESLAAREHRLGRWINGMQMALPGLREERVRQESALREQEVAYRDAAGRQAAAEDALRRCERELALLASERDALENERAQLAREIAAAQRDEAAQTECVTVLGRTTALAGERLAQARAELAQERERIEVSQRGLRELEHRLGLLTAREAAQAATLADLDESVTRLQKEQVSVQTRLRQETAEQERVTASLETEQMRVRELSSILAEQQQSLMLVRSEEPPEQADRADREGTRQRLTEQVGRHERALARLAQSEEERDRLRIEILRELRRSPDSLEPPGDDAPDEDEIRRLRLRANQYPDADLSVVDECRELEERYRTMRKSVEDLNDAMRELDGIMATADREMHTRFDEAFRTLNAEFGRVFEVMLRGGEASLAQLPDAGVAVQARLPGKRARSSASFSGGEKSLVAASLLFGILRLRPIPFVVLDEVDAALDESNVDRYVAALRDISERTQIIIVTHNRATMEAADVLYGVTMNEEGVSRLLSLRLDAYSAAG